MANEDTRQGFPQTVYVVERQVSTFTFQAPLVWRLFVIPFNEIREDEQVAVYTLQEQKSLHVERSLV